MLMTKLNATLPNLTTAISNYSRSSASYSPDLELQQNLQRYAYGYVMLVTCVCGILGNLLALTVLSRRSMRSSNTATYLRCLAVADAFVLVLAIFRYRSYYILLSEQQVIRMVTNFDRYVQVYLVPFFWIFLGVSSFITLSLSLERYLVVRWPFTLKKSYRVGTVRGCTAVAIMGVVMVTLPQFFCYKVKRLEFRGLQVVAVVLDNGHFQARAYLHVYYFYLLPIVWYMLPWLIVAVVNTLLALQVQKSSRIRVGVPNSLNPNRNLSMLIILIVGVYMVCHFPRCILALYCLVNDCSSSSEGDDMHTRTFYIITAIAEILNILNSCLNIVVYCVTGASFRREVKQILFCRSCRKTTVPPPTHQSVHVSLRQVPATPINIRRSFNMSCKELQLTRSRVQLRSPQGSQGDLQAAGTAASAAGCQGYHQSSFVSLEQCAGSPVGSRSSDQNCEHYSQEDRFECPPDVCAESDRKCMSYQRHPGKNQTTTFANAPVNLALSVPDFKSSTANVMDALDNNTYGLAKPEYSRKSGRSSDSDYDFRALPDKDIQIFTVMSASSPSPSELQDRTQVPEAKENLMDGTERDDLFEA